ncbi:MULTISPECIES: glutathione S-transferase family protein [unclassified Pseudomonas]|uniref:glutathione S-transferase family protein n=1 Tax=unclassified Pseudomonas TaxID=196821 RepID=UPI00384C59A8
MLTLISHPLCPFVQRVAIVLREKRIPFERLDVNLEHKPEWFVAISPMGKVPVLRVTPETGPPVALFESTVICEYVEDIQPLPAMYTGTALEKALQRSWCSVASAMLADAWGFLIAADQGTAERHAGLFRQDLERFESVLADGPYFAGRSFGMVDALVAPVFRYLDLLPAVAFGDLFAKLPKVSNWRKALSLRPSVQGAVGEDYAERLQLYLEKRQSIVLSA